MDAPVLLEVGKAHATKVEISQLKRPFHKKKKANSKKDSNSMLGHRVDRRQEEVEGYWDERTRR